MKILAGFGPVPQPKLEVCNLADDRCTQRNTKLEQEYSWNQCVAASVQYANSFIGTYNQGGAIDWTKLTPLTQAIVLGLVTGYMPYDNTISDELYAAVKAAEANGQSLPALWTPAYGTIGASLAPPPGVPNGPGFGVANASAPNPGPASAYPVATYHVSAPLNVVANAVTALLGSASQATLMQILNLLVTNAGA